MKIRLQKYVGCVEHSKWTLWKNHNRITLWPSPLGHLSQRMSQCKLESFVKLCWSKGLGPWQHSRRIEFIKIPLHTEHVYSPEEVGEEDL